ncbi:MAG TPA: type II toxin-antitoxin system VapC family toxin [Geminicoccaceae bacterium]|nr:type II toxin-antitoxin system VapC family toxin [Geminicoccaceae bacterium]
MWSSIVGCWCFPDEASPVADATLSAIAADEAIVPAVWWFEVRNLLITGERVGRMNPVGTAAFLADLETLPIRIDHAPVSDAVLACARTHRLTIYNAGYLELALRVDAPLATLDRQLAQAARAARVPLLGEGDLR